MEEELLLSELETRQNEILKRITAVESKHSLYTNTNTNSPQLPKLISTVQSTTTKSRLSNILRSNGVNDFTFTRVPSDYYEQSLEYRRGVLNAFSVEHLCKSIVLINTQAPSDVVDCSNRNYSKYYVVVVQYTARFNAETVKSFLYSLNNGKIPKKKFNLRLAPEEISNELTGFEHNAVTCIGMKTDIPVILDEAISKLSPDYFWLGGGETDLKLGIRTSEFIDFVKPFIVKCSGN